MFGKSGESEKVAALRLAALKAMHGVSPLSHNIRLTVVVHVGKTNDRFTGDLDNFLTGVCDSLMAAAPNARIAPVFNQPKLASIYPSKPIGILDDCNVVEIHARKVIGDTDAPWYEVELEGD